MNYENDKKRKPPSSIANDKRQRLDRDLDESSEHNTPIRTGVRSATEAAEVVLKYNPYIHFDDGKLYVFDKETGKYDSNGHGVYKSMQRCSHKLHILKKTKKGFELTDQSYAGMDSKQKQLVACLKKLAVSPGWFLSMKNTDNNYLLFNNGYYHDKIFYDKETHGFNPNIMFTGCIPHDFTPQTAEQYAYSEDIKKRFFYQSIGDPDTADRFIQSTGCALSRKTTTPKPIFFGTSPDECGKSAIVNAFNRSFGSYANLFDADRFTNVHKQSYYHSDKAKKWMREERLKGCRIIFSNFIKYRENVDSRELELAASEFVTIIFASYMPKIKMYHDVQIDTSMSFKFKNKFVDTEPENDTEFKKEYGIHKEMDTIRFQQAFVHMVLGAK